MKLQNVIAGCLLVLVSLPSLASEKNYDWAFSKSDASEQALEATAMLHTWAEAEYLEHENEGLFQRFPLDGQVIQATLKLVKEMENHAKQVAAKGGQSAANALLLAAEATAYYATMMPHLLESRIAAQSQVSNQ